MITEKLAEAGIETHFEKLLTPNEVLVKKLDMIPVECVIRNYAAGSLCRRLGVEEGKDYKEQTLKELIDDSINQLELDDKSKERLQKLSQQYLKAAEELIVQEL